MDMFKELGIINSVDLNPNFLVIKNHLPDVRGKINNWSEGFTDRDGKMVREFQTTFYSVFWELYLFEVFRELKLEVDLTHKTPDFLIKSDIPIVIEAVTANIRNEGIKEQQRTIEDTIRALDPPVYLSNFDDMMRESITRLSNSISYKNKKYCIEYKKLNYIKPNMPFVLAVASFDYVHFGREYIYPIVALLYGLYYRKFYDDYKDINNVQKISSKAMIDVNLFARKDYKNISAVIFSSSLTSTKVSSMCITEGKSWNNTVDIVRFDWRDKKMPYKLHRVQDGSGEELTDGLYIFHNPNAINPLDPDLFAKKRITQYKLLDGKLRIKSKYPPLVRRLSLPDILTSNNKYNLMMSGIMTGYNRRDKLIFDYQFIKPF